MRGERHLDHHTVLLKQSDCQWIPMACSATSSGLNRPNERYLMPVSHHTRTHAAGTEGAAHNLLGKYRTPNLEPMRQVPEVHV